MHNKLFIITIAAVVFAAYNIHQYNHNRSFDNCEQLVKEIHRNQQIRHNEILTLQAAITGVEVDYE